MKDFIDFAFLDSGTGGIPYMLSLKDKKKDARCVYLGDTVHFPYGEKSPEEVTRCASESIRLIEKKWNPRALVIACNTISVTALDSLRKEFPHLSIIGTVPAIRLASRVTKNKNIGVLATNATVKNGYNAKLISDFASDCHIFSRGDPELISFIEHDLFTASKEERMKAVKPAVDFFASHDCDTIVLGCTHFTHVAEEIQEAAGDSVAVVDSRDGVANHAIDVESSAGETVAESIKNKDLPPDCAFFCTGLRGKNDETEYETLCRRFNIPWGGVLENSEETEKINKNIME